jgi:hypothetical protein
MPGASSCRHVVPRPVRTFERERCRWPRAPVVISVGLAMSATPQIPDGALHAANCREVPITDIALVTADTIGLAYGGREDWPQIVPSCDVARVRRYRPRD